MLLFFFNPLDQGGNKRRLCLFMPSEVRNREIGTDLNLEDEVRFLFHCDNYSRVSSLNWMEFAR